MNQYEKYKSSGVEWIGEIPNHWNINKFNRIAFYQEGPGLRNWQFKDKGVKVICVTNITEEGINFELLERNISEEEYNSSYQHFTVKKGDYLMSSSGASWGKVAEYLSDEKVILNTSTIRLNTEDENIVKREFLKWIIKSPYITEYLNILLTGSCQPNFGPTHLSQLIAVYPSTIEEQTSIASYLEEKTTQIDRLIANKKKLIELLKEERMALIDEAVNRKKKNWSSKKLKYLASLRDEAIYETDFRIAVENIEGGSGRLIDMNTERAYEGQLTRFVPGDIIFNKLRPYLHKVHLAEKEGGVYGELLVIYSKGELTAEFLYYKLFSKSFIDVVDGSTQGTKMPRANWNDFISQLVMSFPNEKSEQLMITEAIRRETEKIDVTISKIEREAELMREYRTALISEVVTGKVKIA